MTAFKMMLLIMYHLGIFIETKEQVISAINVLVFAQENEPFPNQEKLKLYMIELFYPDGIDPNDKEVGKLIDRAAAKWWYWVIEGRVDPTPENG